MRLGRTSEDIKHEHYGYEVHIRRDGSVFTKIYTHAEDVANVFFKIHKPELARELIKVLTEAADKMESALDFQP